MAELDSEGTVDLTLLLTRSYGARGGIVPKIETRHIRAKKALKTTNVSFCVHNVTHCDLPWRIEWNDVKAVSDLICNDDVYGKLFTKDELHSLVSELQDPKSRQADLSEYFDVRDFPCLIFDITDRQQIVEEYLDVSAEDSSIVPMYVKPSLDRVAATKLFEELKISVDTLKKTFGSSNASLAGKILIFKTGWMDRFEPPAGFNDLSNPTFEAWHGFLTYPYLDMEGVAFLVSKGVIGIGSDSISLETSLFYVEPYSHNYQRYLRPFGELETRVPWGPVHLGFLARRIYLLESLANLGRISTSPGEVVHGTLFLYPLPLGIDDAVLERITFKREDLSETRKGGS